MRRRGDDDSPASLHQHRMGESTLDRRGEKMPECIRCEASLYEISKESERLRQNIIYTDRIRSEDTTGIVSHIKSRTHGSESKTPTCHANKPHAPDALPPCHCGLVPRWIIARKSSLLFLVVSPSLGATLLPSVVVVVVIVLFPPLPSSVDPPRPCDTDAPPRFMPSPPRLPPRPGC